MNKEITDSIIKNKKEKVKTLKFLVSAVFELDLMNKSRLRKYTEARSPFMAIMRDEGYTLSDIGEMLEKNHATVVYGLRSFQWAVKTEHKFREKHLEVKRLYDSNESLIDLKSEFELKKSIISLNNEIKLLHLENMSLKKDNQLLKNSHSKYKDLYKLIEERTRERDIPLIYRKLNMIYNGL